ncbi:MAG: hypothetical protein KDA85_18750 [Planctomycetaceae bacterium]|nr:hypothetical protein [Planctomycetaceae bacterium]
MSLFNFFFPGHTRTEQQRAADAIDAEARAHRQRDAAHLGELEHRVQELEQDLGFVALLLGGILDVIDKKGVATREDVQESIERLDMLDGLKDGRLDINALKRH